MPTALESQYLARMDKIEAMLEKAASRPASRAAAPNNVFAEFRQDWKSDEWPVERLKKLSDAYGNDSTLLPYLTKGGGRRSTRTIGWGPALLKMLELADPARSSSVAVDEFEKQYGFATVENARSRGVKQLNGEIRKTALAENSGQTGGYIVPPQFMQELLTIAGEDSFVEPRCKVVPMNSRTMQFPMLDITTAYATGTTPYAGGILAAWQPEAALINETEPQFKLSEWVAWDLVLYAVSSNQLLADNGIGLDALLTQLFAWGMTWYKEFAFLQGTGAGSSMPLGVLNAPATIVQNRATTSHFKLQDAAAMMSHLQIRSWDDACWVMHQSVLPELIQLSDVSATLPGTAGQHLAWVSPIGDMKVGGAAMKLPQAFLNGLPIFFTEKVPSLGNKGDVMLVDFSRYLIGQRLDIQIDVSPHYLFRNNQLAWRVVARCDGKPWLNNSITDAEGFTVSPFVILNK